MPYRVANTFQPLTPIGEGIQNITRALFSGPTDLERENIAAQAEARRLQAEHYRAQNEKLRAETAARLRAEQEMANAPAKMVGAIFGNQQKADDYLASVRGDQVPTFGAGKTGGLDAEGGDGPAYAPAPVPMPQGLDPNAVARAARLLTGVHAARALPGNDNMAHLAKMIGELEAQDARSGIVGGKANATDVARAFFATSGKSPYDNMGGTGTFNLLTGENSLNPLGQAKVKLTDEQRNTEVTKQGENRAQAGAAGARAAVSREELNRLKSDGWVPVLDVTTGLPKLDANNQPILIRQSARGTAMQRTEGSIAAQDNKDANRPEPRAGAAGKPRPLTKNDTTLMRAEVDALLSSLDAEDADEQTKRAIIAEAEKQWQGGAAGHAAAVKAAVDKLAPGGFERSGFIGFRKSKPAGGAQAPVRPITQGAPAAPGGAMPSPRSQAEYDALPAGAQYIGSDGAVRVKGQRVRRNNDGTVGS